jgi:hypothetical protein
MSQVAKGLAAFSNLTEHDVYNGQSTGKYGITVRLDPECATELESLGVRLKDYEGVPQRKFSTKFNVEVIDAEGNPYAGEVPRGSRVNVLFDVQGDDPRWGPSTFLHKVRVVKEAEEEMDVPGDF